jgi:hypothetical protein
MILVDVAGDLYFSNNGNLLWTPDGNGSVGALSPGVAEVTQVVCVADVANSLRGTSFLINAGVGGATDYYVWYKTSGVGTDPMSASTGIMVDVPTGSTAAAVASATEIAMEATGDFSVSTAGGTLVITNTDAGAANDAVDVDTGFSISTVTQGLNAGWGINRPANVIVKDYIRAGDGDYFTNSAPYASAIEIAAGANAAGLWMNADSAGRLWYGFSINEGGGSYKNWGFKSETSGLAGRVEVFSDFQVSSDTWLVLDGSTDDGVDSQTIRFADVGHLEWQTDGGTGDGGSIGKAGSGRPSEIHTKNLLTVGGKGYQVRSTTVTTSDATATNVQVFSADAGVVTAYGIKARITGVKTGGSSGVTGDCALYELMATVKNILGTLSVQNLQTLYSYEDQAGWAATIDVSGTSVRVRVTGASNNIISWACTTEISDAT